MVQMSKRILLYLCVALAAGAVAVSCNSDSSDSSYSYSSSVAITSFVLGEDDDVLENLDSVHFTIDLDRCLIYNADSLPVGTDVTKLLVELSYESAYSVNFNIKNGEVMTNDTTFEYSSSDSIDFSGEAYIIIVAADKVTQRTYTVNVNVHQIEPDSLWWDELACRSLPSKSGSPTNQRTVKYDGQVLCLMAESGGYVLATTDDPSGDSWTQTDVTFPFNPDLRSLTATTDALYILDEDYGTLYTSTDFSEWTSCGVEWEAISGGYLEYVLGVANDDGVRTHTIYPDGSDFVPYTIEDDFPVTKTSDMHTFTTIWNISYIGLLMGGVKASGEYTMQTWGFDGETWAQISAEDTIAARAGMVFFPYFTHETSTCWEVTEYSTWFAVEGQLEDGTNDKTLYYSRDSGVNWVQGDTLIQMPDYIDALTEADVILFDTTYEVATRSGSVWRQMPSTKLPPWCHPLKPGTLATRTAAAITEWDCPYIYLFGGYDDTGTLSDNIWKGVINRLSFEPLY